MKFKLKIYDRVPRNDGINQTGKWLETHTFEAAGYLEAKAHAVELVGSRPVNWYVDFATPADLRLAEQT